MVGTGASTMVFACDPGNSSGSDPANLSTHNSTVLNQTVTGLSKSKSVTLTSKQLTTLNNTQGKLDKLTVTINNLTAAYNSTKGDKSLLLALKLDGKQAISLNNTISKFKSDPTGNAALKIESYVLDEKLLQQQVSEIEKLLAKQFYWIHFKI